MSQLAVYDLDGTNIAERRPVTASPVSSVIFLASYAVDGVLEARAQCEGYRCYANRGYHSKEFIAFWEVDLGSMTGHDITHIGFYNRADLPYGSTGYELMALSNERELMCRWIIPTADLVQTLYAETSSLQSYPTATPSIQSTLTPNNYHLYPTFPPNTGRVEGGIQYHGGAVLLGEVRVYVIWYGDWSGVQGEGSNEETQRIITEFVKHIGGSSWWHIMTSYTGADNVRVSNSLTFSGSITIPSSESVSKGKMERLILYVVASKALPVDENAIYVIIPSENINDIDNTNDDNYCANYCGYHSSYSYIFQSLKYVFITHPYKCTVSSTCAPDFITISANNNRAADAIVDLIGHQLARSVSNPNGDGWYRDSDGLENAEICKWDYGTLFTGQNDELNANIMIGNRFYLLQKNWLNIEQGVCSISLS